ncbi:MAG: hypothetical protein AAF489_05095 [Bacteroidota bacterium]
MWSCKQRVLRAENSLDYIPENNESVIKIAHLETTTSDFASSNLFAQLKQPILYNFLKDQSEFISRLQTDSESVICFQKLEDSVRHFTFITPTNPSVLVLDSTYQNETNVNTYKGHQIAENTFGGNLNYSARVDSMFVASSSEVILKEIIDNKTKQSASFKKAYSLKTKDGLVSLIQPTAIRINDSLTLNFASQAALELQVFPDGISASGVVLDRDSLPQLLHVFRGLHPQPNRSANVTPISAKQTRAITYDDADLLELNLQKYHKNSQTLDPLFGSINEITGLQLVNENAVVLKSIDPAITDPEFKRFTSEAGKFREITLYNFSESLGIFDAFAPFIDPIQPQFAFQWEDFFVFTETETMAQQLITAYTNGTTLAKTPYYENSVTQLSQSSSFLVYNLQGAIDPWLAPFLGAQSSQVSKFPLAALQLSYDRDFAHINLVCKEASRQQQRTGLITQVFSKQLDAMILGEPQFFSNHRTRGKDVVVQDIQNKLYLISASGAVLWKKQLDGPVLGQVQEVDILRNGKKQLALATPNTFYILDRNGKSVAPFPKKYRDKITQPLAVFDYDNKRKYRFVITQGKDVHMYDRDGKTVSGFTFKKAGSDIVLPPQHIRMGNKDYLLIAEESGKLNILSRVGKDRVKTNKTFVFSETPILREGQSFVVIDKENTRHSISQGGKVTSKKLNVSEQYWYAIRGGTKITLDDNLLRVNGKLVELPFGVYGQPKLCVSNRKTYVTVTDVQEKKVYVLDKSGNILNGFPVYGSGQASMGDAKNNDKNALVVKGNDNEVIVYSLD